MSKKEHLVASDFDTLQGVWRQVSLEADGVANPPDEHTVTGALCYISSTHFMVRAPDGTVLIAGDFELGPSTQPKRITWIDSIGADQGKRLPAIYTLEQDRFTFIAADEDQPWPTEFKTVPGLTMRSFCRAE